MATAALVISVIALAMAVASAWYSHKQERQMSRQADAAEAANWLDTPLDFRGEIVEPNSGAAKLRLMFKEGVQLDHVEILILNSKDGPAVGFGVGTADRTALKVPGMSVGDVSDYPLVQRLGPTRGTYQAGDIRLRLTCRQDKLHRDVAVLVNVAGRSRYVPLE